MPCATGQRARVHLRAFSENCSVILDVNGITSWLCGARECSMISTNVKPLSAQVFCLANQPACMSRCLLQQELSPLCLLSRERRDRLPPVGVSTGIRAARTHSQIPCPIVTCPEHKVADLHDFTVILRCVFSTRVGSVTLRVRRVRLNHSEDVRTKRSNVAQSRILPREKVGWARWW